MTFLGARGQTADELEQGLQLTGSKASIGAAFRSVLAPLQDTSSVLKVVNKIYASCSVNVNPNFNAEVNRDFFSTIQQLNFRNAPQAAQIINNYVANHTNNLITDLIEPSLLSNAQLVLINAVYFKSTWQFPFIRKETQKDIFYIDDNLNIQVDTMHLTVNNIPN